MLGCLHRRTTFPQTPKPRAGFAIKKQPYVVCVDCGRQFNYNWQDMKIEVPTLWDRVKSLFVSTPQENKADVR